MHGPADARQKKGERDPLQFLLRKLIGPVIGAENCDQGVAA